MSNIAEFIVYICKGWNRIAHLTHYIAANEKAYKKRLRERKRDREWKKNSIFPSEFDWLTFVSFRRKCKHTNTQERSRETCVEIMSRIVWKRKSELVYTYISIFICMENAAVIARSHLRMQDSSECILYFSTSINGTKWMYLIIVYFQKLNKSKCHLVARALI